MVSVSNHLPSIIIIENHSRKSAHSHSRINLRGGLSLGRPADIHPRALSPWVPVGFIPGIVATGYDGRDVPLQSTPQADLGSLPDGVEVTHFVLEDDLVDDKGPRPRRVSACSRRVVLFGASRRYGCVNWAV